jgi:hypothetical protein
MLLFVLTKYGFGHIFSQTNLVTLISIDVRPTFFPPSAKNVSPLCIAAIYAL